ncbi:hypothetical protein IWQ60_009217 [Tieghemiomyces parasiticus]|uniref:Small nuclear ribonucleoprotein G n=1 Tax=Tieghemiomyces parasiticus TaxID=78921 RepID=A0A9W8DPZ2_9FUNG|nr:hypothetical protein IWQ60_012028 [Tieghemiomyces parasiticus]KAJ1913422.1 hypothetical protein IWQ60_009217 [Tieghemiomyces parasiticus]
MSASTGPAVSKAAVPELKSYMEKRLMLQINGRRRVSGVLRGYDPFMNVVLDDAKDETAADAPQDLGMIVVRGNSIELMEGLEQI